MKTNDKIFFPNLDGLRFFCFFVVFMVHSLVTESAVINNNPAQKFVKFFVFESGFLGVNMFFVLSGFLITYLLIREKQQKKNIDIKKFYMRRVLRIWPLYFFCVFFGFVIFPMVKTFFGEVPNETANPIYYFFFLSNFDLINTRGADSSMLNILWSVSIEEQFYLVWPIVVYFTKPKKLWLVTVFIILGTLTIRYIYSFSFIEEIHTIYAATDLACGCLFACIASFKGKISKVLEQLPLFAYIGIHISCVALFLMYGQVSFGPVEFLKRFIFAINFSLVIYLQCFSAHSLLALSKLKIISSLGKYTYGLYCLHMIAILAVTKTVFKIIHTENIYVMYLIELPLSLLLSIVISKVSYKYFESYFLRLKAKFTIIKTREID